MLMATCALSLASAIYGQNIALKRDRVRPIKSNAVPASVRPQSGRLPINGSFKVAVKDYADDRLRAGIARMLTRLAGRTVLTLPADLAADESTATLVVQCERAGDTIPSLSENESYSLAVTDKQARLVAPTVVGALRGLETFLQTDPGRSRRILSAGYQDSRSAALSLARFTNRRRPSLEPLEVLKRNLDAMAAVKLNVFHWHLSETRASASRARNFRSSTRSGPMVFSTPRTRCVRSLPMLVIAASGNAGV